MSTDSKASQSSIDRVREFLKQFDIDVSDGVTVKELDRLVDLGNVEMVEKKVNLKL